MTKTTPKQTTTTIRQPINPFFTALNGIQSLFSNALSVGIVLLLISVVGTLTAMVDQDNSTNNNANLEQFKTTIANIQPQEWAIIGVVTLVIVVFAMVVSAMLHGIQSYTALKLSRGEKVTIGEAFSAVLARFGGYIILYLWMNIKIALWTLLFIIPGIHAYYRYSFAGILFFDKNLVHEKALKESSRIAKGGLMTLFSSNLLFNMITLGYITSIITIATQSELYREYTALDKAKAAKPSIHWLSWVTLALPFVFIAGIILLSIVIAVIIGLTGGFAAR